MDVVILAFRWVVLTYSVNAKFSCPRLIRHWAYNTGLRARAGEMADSEWAGGVTGKGNLLIIDSSFRRRIFVTRERLEGTLARGSGK